MNIAFSLSAILRSYVDKPEYILNPVKSLQEKTKTKKVSVNIFAVNKMGVKKWPSPFRTL